MATSTALAHPNIAFIKYWGNRDQARRIPANGSLSMNLAGLETRTTVTFSPELAADSLTLNGGPVTPQALARVRGVLGIVRSLAGIQRYARVESENNFPAGAGIASSASAFAALALAASAAAGLDLSERDLSRLARTGSGSACRSVPAGFTEWLPGTGDEDSYAISLATPDHWDLCDCIAVISREHKPTGSTRGHRMAATSPLQAARVADAHRRLDLCRQALYDRDFTALAEIAELDSNLMHAIMQTSNPPLLYYLPHTLTVMQAVQGWRQGGLPVFYTIDAGPNVHVICPQPYQGEISSKLEALPGVQEVMVAGPGGAARVLDDEE